MYAHVSSAKSITAFSATPETDACPVLAELTKKMHFFRFLQKEMNTARTEAEKEAVFSILMKTRVQIFALKREWERVQEMEEPGLHDSHPTPEIYAAHRIQ